MCRSEDRFRAPPPPWCTSPPVPPIVTWWPYEIPENPAETPAEPEVHREPALSHGVGPWPGGPESWPVDPRLDPDLLANGDTRNVVDEYRYWRMDAIVADLFPPTR